jgi:hypothetical protein
MSACRMLLSIPSQSQMVVMRAWEGQCALHSISAIALSCSHISVAGTIFVVISELCQIQLQSSADTPFMTLVFITNVEQFCPYSLNKV